MLPFLNQLPLELIWLLQIPVCYSFLLLSLRFLGASGIFLFNSVAIVLANLQVLKAVSLYPFENPIALGTVVFSTTFLGTDILSEYFDKKTAQKAILAGFIGLLFSTVLMTLTIGMAPPSGQPSSSWFIENHFHLEAIFKPAPALLVSGMMAYWISQWFDVALFNRMKKKSHGRFLWLRNNVSTALSALVDNTIFSLLAWIVLATDPLPWRTVIFSYILGTYGIRLFLAVIDTPIIYIAQFCLPRSQLPLK